LIAYVWFGLRMLPRAWINLDILWALSLVLVGAVGVWTAL
jgi:hypothetical protein